MVVEVRVFTIFVPKGGTAAGPQIFPLTMPVRIVDGVEIYIPAGANGQLHFALGVAGTSVLPTNPGAYIIANDEVIHWPLDHQIDSGAWQLLAYNTGSVNHLIHIRFLLTPPGMDRPPAGAVYLDALTIELPGGTSDGGGGGQPPPGASFSFSIETPLTVLDVQAGGSGTITMLLDETGTRPGAYSVTFGAVQAGVTLTAVAGNTPTAWTLAATVDTSVAAQSYTTTVTVVNGTITNTATLTIAVSAAPAPPPPGPGPGPAATLGANPTIVVAGNNVTAIGANFGAAEAVTLYLGSLTLGVIADSNGNFIDTIAVPRSFQAGSYVLTATGTKHSATGPTITITAAPSPTLAVSSMTVQAGGVLSFTGTNWGNSTQVVILFASNYEYVYAGANGNLSGQITVPANTGAGSYTLQAQSGTQSASVSGITVTAAPPPPPGPVTVTFDGSNHVVTAGSDLSLNLVSQWGYAAVTITTSTGSALSGQTDGQGVMLLHIGSGYASAAYNGVWTAVVRGPNTQTATYHMSVQFV